MPVITLASDQIWLKGTGSVSQVWSPTVSGLPARAIINSVVLTFTSGNFYASPGRTEVFWGSEALAANRLWYVSLSGGGGTTTAIDLTGRVTGNGTFSLLFRKTANSASSQSNVYFTGPTVTIDYTNPISTFSLDKTTVEAGGALTVTISRVDSSYTHRVTFAFGSRSYTATGVGTSVSCTIPLAWLDQIPNATSGSGTVKVETISSAGASMGAVTASITITAGAGVVPTVGTVTAEVVDGLEGLYIQGHSRCRVAADGYGAGTGASIASVLISGNGDSVWSDAMTSSLLRTAGTATFTVTVKDSRGRTASGSISITVTAYTDVAITARMAQRCLSDGTVSRTRGKSALLGCSYAITAVGGNAATVRVYWRAYGEEGWTEITGWDSKSGYTAVALADEVALDGRYEIRFVVADRVSLAEQTAMIAPGSVFMVWSKIKNAFGFGAYPTGEKQVAIAEDWSLMLGQENVGNALRQRDRVRNLLDNSDFRSPVNQRGRAGESLQAGYVLDRWRTWAAGAVYFSTGKYMGVEGANLVQYLPEPYDRGILTLAVKKYGVETPYVCTWDTSVIGNIHNGVSAISRDESALSVLLFPGAAYEWAALYEGEYTAETLPPYVPKGYAAELAECRRYYQPNRTMLGRAINAGYIAISHNFSPPMRIPPTCTAKSVKLNGIGDSLYSGDVNLTGDNDYKYQLSGGGNIYTAGEIYQIIFDASADL